MYTLFDPIVNFVLLEIIIRHISDLVALTNITCEASAESLSEGNLKSSIMLDLDEIKLVSWSSCASFCILCGILKCNYSSEATYLILERDFESSHPLARYLGATDACPPVHGETRPPQIHI
uniref:Secreted protein n=1 Tax=Heterorhabditis bacteriophora TaxID=37862 RepID=A0A1I7X2P8_HETBA